MLKNILQKRCRHDVLGFILTCAFMIACLALFIASAKNGLNVFEFGDETEKFVAAQLINQGQKLYLEIFAHHGPVPYILAHIYSVLISAEDFTNIRYVMVLFALLAAVSIYLSPIHKHVHYRLLSTGVFLACLSSVWVLIGAHMILYQHISGLLFVIPCSQLLLPAILKVKPSKYGLFWSGASIVAIGFSGYSLGPACLLLLLAAFLMLIEHGGLRVCKQPSFAVLFGMIGSALLILIWMLLYADLKGYVIYHLYFNQSVYKTFIEYELISMFQILDLSFQVNGIVVSIFLITTLLSLALMAKAYLLSRHETSVFRPLPILSGLALVGFLLFLNPRGALGENSFHGATQTIVFITVSALSAAFALQQHGRFLNLSRKLQNLLVAIAALFTLEQVSRDAVSSPHKYAKSNFENRKVFLKPDSEFDLIRTFAKEDDRLLVLPFAPRVYIQSGVLPALGTYYYLPWQAEYNKNPIAGYATDICSDTVRPRPTFIWYVSVTIWEKYPIDDYEPCIREILNANYTAMGKSNIYFLSDFLQNSPFPLPLENWERKPSAQLEVDAPIEIALAPFIQNGESMIEKIGVRLATYRRTNQGTAELVLRSSTGETYQKEFQLPEVLDNGYKYFDVPAANYVSGEIRSTSGSGISTWESHSANDILTCINYFYQDRQVVVTPGCPN